MKSILFLRRFFNQQQLAWRPKPFNPINSSNVNSMEEPLEDISNPSLPYHSTHSMTANSNRIMSNNPNSIMAIMPFPEEQGQNYSHNFPASAPVISDQITQVLLSLVDPQEVEIKPDGSIYLPEIKYRKRLLQAFGPTGWTLLPRGPHSQIGNYLSREYALYVGGRIVSQARGVSLMQSFSNPGLASESVRSNALMRCCKDLGIASELWNIDYVEKWKAERAIRRQDKNGKFIWLKKEDGQSQQY